MIQISTPQITSVRTISATFGSDFGIVNETAGVVTVTLLPSERMVAVGYIIIEDDIAESKEVFQISFDGVRGTPNFSCDAGPMSQNTDYECFPSLQVFILDDDGEPILFRW